MKSDFFFHNATERKASLALIVLILLIWILTFLWPLFSVQKKYNLQAFELLNKDFETEMLLAESAAEDLYSKKKSYPKKEYQEKDDHEEFESKKSNKKTEIEKNKKDIILKIIIVLINIYQEEQNLNI